MGQRELQTGLVWGQVYCLCVEFYGTAQFWRFGLVQLIAELPEQFALLGSPESRRCTN